MGHPDKIRSALQTWAPTYPRRAGVHQEVVESESAAVDRLLAADDSPDDIPFLSTYAFPRGHTTANHIPRVDTLFIDFDFDGGNYESGSGDVRAWRQDLSQLLVRARRVASYILESGQAANWRAALSGHKGVHLFLDFDPIPPSAGSQEQFAAGTEQYAHDLIDHIADETRLRSLPRYVDVTSSDLARLCRAPNTLHGGATDSFGDERYCVPVSIEELADIDVDTYLELTAEPREAPRTARDPSAEVADVIQRYVTTAEATSADYVQGTSTVNYSLVEDYQERANENITLEDIQFLTADRPCVWNFYQRDDKYQHGQQSHYMELFCIRELLEHNVPIDVIHDFLDSAPEYDEEYSQERIEQIISRDYNRFTVEKILRNAPEFAASEGCQLCQRVIGENDDLRDRFR
jgi:hypothetical protein